jgi:phosphohistidine swiveling domain-containing protein
MIYGQGELVSGDDTTGSAREVSTVDDVLRLLDEPNLEEMILVTTSASATTLMPLLGEIGGVVCAAGGPTSHLAVIARDFGLTCIMGATSIEPATLDGHRVQLTKDGQVLSVGALDSDAAPPGAPGTRALDQDAAASGARGVSLPKPRSRPISTRRARFSESGSGSVQLTPEAIERANATILEIGDVMRTFFRAEKREQLTSVMFDVPRRSMLGWNCVYADGPMFVRELLQHTTPEDLGRMMRMVGTRPYQLQLGLLFLSYLGARQQRMLDAGLSDGEPFADEDIGNTIEFMDFCERVQRSYRGDGTLTPERAGYTTRILDDDTVGEVASMLAPARAEQFRPMQRTLGILEMYAFLLHGEQRDGVFGRGPYDIGDGSQMFIREINDLQNDYLPWAATDAQNPHANVIFAYQADVQVACDVFGTLVVRSAGLDERLRATSVMTREGSELRPLSQSELQLAEKAASAATREMYRAVAAWSEEYKLEYGGPLFANHMKTFFDLAGVDNGVGVRLMDTFERTASEIGPGLLSAPVPTVWQHMAHGEGRCFFPIVM